jgi:hypothetical protein
MSKFKSTVLGGSLINKSKRFVMNKSKLNVI